MKKNMKVIVLIGILLVVIAGLLCYIFLKSSNNSNNSKTVVNKNQEYGMSFKYKQLAKNNINLSDDEKNLLDYFDTSYLTLTSNLSVATKKYPSLFKNSKMSVEGEIKQILKSDDNNYQIILRLYNDDYDIDSSDGYYQNEEDRKKAIQYEQNHYVLIYGNQQIERFKENDYITVYGTFETSELISYQNENISMTKLKADKWVNNGNKFNNDELRKIGKLIFGDNIRFADIQGCASNAYCENYPSGGLLVKLENPKNSNYTMFNIFNSGGFIEVGYCNADNFMQECNDTQQEIEIASDYKHFIILTYETATETAYLEYYDQDFNKIWRNEIDKNGSTSKGQVRAYYDYNDNYLVMVVDGYFHLIDLKTGKDKIDPAIIGTDHQILMFPDYALLVGYNKKDYLIKIDYNGKVIKKLTMENSQINEIEENNIQLVGDDITITAYGTSQDNKQLSKIIKINSKLDIIHESDDFEI